MSENMWSIKNVWVARLGSPVTLCVCMCEWRAFGKRKHEFDSPSASLSLYTHFIIHSLLRCIVYFRSNKFLHTLFNIIDTTTSPTKKKQQQQNHNLERSANISNSVFPREIPNVHFDEYNYNARVVRFKLQM